ncbi:unnamed protein product, partial [Closterium sp. NIES-53]
TSPTLCWMGKVGDASVFLVWGSRAFVRDTSADKLSARVIPCVFLGFVPNAPGWLFYHPTSRRILPSQDITFDEPVPFYRLFPYRSTPSTPPPLFLAPGPPPVDPLPPQGPAPSGVSQVDPLPGTASIQVAVVSGAAPGAASGGAASGGAEPGGAGSEGAGSGGAEPEGVEPGGAESEGAEPGGAESEGAESGGAEPRGAASSGGPAGASPRLSSQQLHEWLVQRPHRRSGAPRAGEPGDAGAGGAAVTTRAGDPTEPRAGGAGGAGAGVAGVGSPGVGGAGAAGAGVVDPGDGACLSSCLTCSHCSSRAPRSRPPPVLGTHTMALRPSSIPLRVPLPTPPESSLPEVPDTDLLLLLLDLVAACRLDYTTALVTESVSASPPSVGGECALGTDVLEDRQEDLEYIPSPRSYAEAITGPYSSQWQAAMDAEMASWKSTGTYVDEVPPPGVNIVDGMWIFRVKRPPGSPPAFKARYVARGFNQRQGVDYFQTFYPTPTMTTLRVFLHVVAQRDYQLHSLDFSTAFLQGSLHEEIWLRRPPGFTGSFPTGTQWSLRRPVYGLRQVPREWHDTLRTTLGALVYVDDLFFASADTEALTLVKFELQKRHTRTDLGELRSYVGLQITRDRARRTIILTQSHMVHQSVEPSGPYPELVGCLMYLMTCTRPDLVYPLSLLARYVAPGRHRNVHWDAAKRVLRYLCSTLGMGLVLGGRGPVVLTCHADASWSTRSSSVLSSSCEAEIYVGAMAAQELRCLTYLLTDLGEQPRSPPVLHVGNKAMIALCQEHRLEHRTKHIALRYFLARELQ